MAGLVLTVMMLGSPIQGDENSPGLYTKLVPLEPAYQIGKPMPLRVELINASAVPAPYSPYTGYAQYNGRLVVTGPQGKSIPYVGAWSGDQEEMGASSPTLKAGGSVTVCTIDLAANYLMIRPGRYTLQHNGEFVPKSNPIEVIVESGQVSEADEVIDRLFNEFGADWTLEKVLPDNASPEGFRPPNGVVQVNLTEGAPGYGKAPIVVWQVKQPVDLAAVHDVLSSITPFQYFGKNDWGPVYVRDSALISVLGELKPERNQALGVLPRIRERLARALSIRTTSSSRRVGVPAHVS